MNQSVGRIFIIVILLAASGVQAFQLRLGVDPLNAPEIMKKELKPILEFMDAKYDLQYIPSRATQELLNLAREGKINCAYVSLGYAYLLQEMGFVPLLVSEEQVSLALIGKPNFDLAIAKHNSDQNIYYVKNDLFAKFKIHQGKNQFQWAAQAVPSMTSENIIFKLLQEPSSIGFVMGDEIGLLHETMRDHLKVYKRENIGPVYFLVNKEISAQWGQLQTDFLAFHQAFKDPSQAYNYLRIYHFKKNLDRQVDIDKDFQQYLQRYQ